MVSISVCAFSDGNICEVFQNDQRTGESPGVMPYPVSPVLVMYGSASFSHHW